MRKKIIALIIGAVVLSMAMTTNFSTVKAVECFWVINGCKKPIYQSTCDGAFFYYTHSDCLNSLDACDTIGCDSWIVRGSYEDYYSCSCPIGISEDYELTKRSVYCRTGDTVSTATVEFCAKDESVYGDIGNPVNGGSFGSDVKSGLMGFINTIINFITFLAGGLLLLVMIVSGIRVIIGGKDAKVLGENMKRILFAAIGLVIVMLAYVITGFISGLLFGDETLLNPVVNGPS